MAESLPLRWLYLDLNSYFASVEQQRNPDLRGKPIVVAAMDTDSTSAIAASYAAKAFGIRTGTKIGDARAMCRELIVVAGNHEEYTRYHRAIIAEVERHIPVTAVCSIDEVACRLLTNENTAASVTALAARIKAGIRDNVGVCLTSSIGVAPNRLLAKMAADMKKPDGLTILESATLHDRLCTLKLSDIPGVGRNMERRLAAAGIVTMDRLLNLNAREARQVWGSIWGERLHWLLQGVDLAEIPTQSRSIGHSQVLAPDRRNPDRARIVTRRLLAKAATRLRRAGSRSGMITLMVRGEGVAGQKGAKWNHAGRLTPAMDTMTLLTALETLWSQMLAEFGSHRLLQTAVTLSELVADNAVQLHLFDSAAIDPRTEARRMALSKAMDRVNQRFGRDAVTLGHDSMGASRSSGPKIAFTRIPDMAEFHE